MTSPLLYYVVKVTAADDARWEVAMTRRLAAMLGAVLMTGLASLEATPAADRGLLDGRPEAVVDLDAPRGCS